MLWCYSCDKGKWAESIIEEAKKRNFPASLFTNETSEMKDGDYVFMRIPQWEPECKNGKNIARRLHENGLKLIPELDTVILYEDKLGQTYKYSDWMPKTFAIEQFNNGAKYYTDQLGFPFISKSSQASSSVNVRVIENLEQAESEFNTVQNDGIDIKIGKGRTSKHKNYLIWQKLCKGNKCDYRVVITGRFMILLQRDNKPGTYFASGSGSNRPINQPMAHEVRVLEKAKEFFDAHNMKWNGIDLVYDHDEEDWKILETTLGWSMNAYHECRYFGTNYKGIDIFKLLLDEIEEGVFE